ncbi:hypothetical protein EV204_105165 [Tissierella praeacuta]|uniref:hypothetical protein n=1 Tax=Tissierella praeacuta TaxID=43131 RepID=UPI001046AE3A|nr:hypothetical protein [Tissierella praeacuta]TCU72829.1 hypothetical protein EV204_105165 [Tissierella praeacuta]
MGLSNRQFARARAEPKYIPTGRQTQINNGYTSTLSPFRSRTGDVLKTLRSIPEEAAAIEYLKRVNPDVSMAVWNFVRLANQGNEMHFYGLDGKTRRTDLESKWREFASRINEISNSGLDGLIDQLHYSSFLLGAMGVEVEVTPDRKDIYDVYPVKPQTIEWELKEIKGRKTWVPFQYHMTKKVYLDKEHANFFWVPADPDIGDPRGTLTMTPVLQAIDFQMQILQDLQAVLHHQGYPRNDIEIVLERLMTYCPPHIKNNPKELQNWLNEQHNNIVNMMENIAPDSDYIHFDDVKINMTNGANGGRSLDVRAINELVDVQVLNGLKQLGTFANRSAGKTETWSTVEFLIMTQGIKSCQRGSKRLIEEIARLWLRVNGEQAIAKFKHGVVNWQSEEDKQTVALMKQEFYVIAQLMGWISGDKASQEVMGNKGAVGKPNENIRISFNNVKSNTINEKENTETT